MDVGACTLLERSGHGSGAHEDERDGGDDGLHDV